MRLQIATCMSLFLVLGCGDTIETEPFDAENGLLGMGIGHPFPNAQQVGEDGKLALDSSQFPPAPDPFPADLANYRTGFSPVQVAVLDLPDLSCGQCPGWKKPTPGEGSVLLVDLTDGTFLPVFAELDAHEDAKKTGDHPSMLIRPMTALPYDHDVAIVITTDVMPRPERFDKIVSGVFEGPWADHYRDVVTAVTDLGVTEDSIALAWDFPVGDGNAPTRSAARQAQPTGSFSIDFIKDDTNPEDELPDSMARMGLGKFETTNFINAEGVLDIDPATGEIAPSGTRDVDLVVAIPDSARTAAPGSMPVILYGHGVFMHPEIDIFSATNDWVLTTIATELNMVIVAAPWGGMDSDGFVTAAAVANNLAKFPNLASLMVQGQGNHQALLRLLREGELAQDPIFHNDSGASVVDTSRTYFWGVSMGGILGGVLAAQEDTDFEAAVFHVGGGAFSTLLERASLWTQFELFVTGAVEDPAHRQHLYAAGQLFWDPVDPVTYGPELQDQLILLQESTNDDTVPNMTTRLAARAYGLPVLEPSVDGPYGLEGAPADLPAGSRAMVQFDPEREPPSNKNRPAEGNGAHTATLNWWETYQQAIEFLRPGQEGSVLHYCGTDPCSTSNRG